MNIDRLLLYVPIVGFDNRLSGRQSRFSLGEWVEKSDAGGEGLLHGFSRDVKRLRSFERVRVVKNVG